MSNEINLNLRDRIQKFKYLFLSFDESTYISDIDYLLIFARGITESLKIAVEMLYMVNLKTPTKCNLYISSHFKLFNRQ